jgi:hypothetical protein
VSIRSNGQFTDKIEQSDDNENKPVQKKQTKGPVVDDNSTPKANRSGRQGQPEFSVRYLTDM